MRLIRIAFAALVVLALTATIAFAARDDTPPPAAEPGLETARDASGQDVPVRANEAAGELDEEEILEPEVEADPEVAPDLEVDLAPAVEGGEHCIAPEAEAAEPLVDGEEPNHGAIVCGAARFGDWEAAGCDNHGQYVRTFANKNHDGELGECEATETAETELAVETTDAAGATAGATGGPGPGNGQASGNGQGHGRGQGRP